MTHYIVCSVAQSSLTLCSSMDCGPPGSSMEFSRQEYWSGVSFPTPGDLSHPGMELTFLESPALAGGFLTMCHLRSPYNIEQKLNINKKLNWLKNRFKNIILSKMTYRMISAVWSHLKILNVQNNNWHCSGLLTYIIRVQNHHGKDWIPSSGLECQGELGRKWEGIGFRRGTQ